jgi:hypothetical protein
MVPFDHQLVGVADRAGYPVLTVPTGYGTGTAGRNPIGIAFIGRQYGEGTLLSDGFAYEQATKVRLAPSVTNPSMFRCVPGSAFFSPHHCHPGDRLYVSPFATAPAAGRRTAGRRRRRTGWRRGRGQAGRPGAHGRGGHGRHDGRRPAGARPGAAAPARPPQPADRDGAAGGSHAAGDRRAARPRPRRDDGDESADDRRPDADDRDRPGRSLVAGGRDGADLRAADAHRRRALARSRRLPVRVGWRTCRRRAPPGWSRAR